MSFNWFKYTTILVVVLFCSIIVYVVHTAQSRKYSGVTGVDAAQIHAMRYESNQRWSEEKKEGRSVEPILEAPNAVQAQ